MSQALELFLVAENKKGQADIDFFSTNYPPAVFVASFFKR